jgi:hypothetical protein
MSAGIIAENVRVAAVGNGTDVARYGSTCATGIARVLHNSMCNLLQDFALAPQGTSRLSRKYSAIRTDQLQSFQSLADYSQSNGCTGMLLALSRSSVSSGR